MKPVPAPIPVPLPRRPLTSIPTMDGATSRNSTGMSISPTGNGAGCRTLASSSAPAAPLGRRSALPVPCGCPATGCTTDPAPLPRCPAGSGHRDGRASAPVSLPVEHRRLPLPSEPQTLRCVQEMAAEDYSLSSPSRWPHCHLVLSSAPIALRWATFGAACADTHLPSSTLSAVQERVSISFGHR